MTHRTTRAADEAALAQMEALPAANDSRWKLRAVAGLAGIGLAGLVAIQTLRNVPGPEMPPAPVAALSTPAPAPLQDQGPEPEERDAVAPQAASSAGMGSAAPAAGKSFGATAVAPAAFPLVKSREATAAREVNTMRAEVAMAAAPPRASTPDVDRARWSNGVNAAVRAYFSGGLPTSKPGTSVALFTAFMKGDGEIARSKLEYVVGQSLSQLSESAATSERFVALGVPRDQIGSMGTMIVTDGVATAADPRSVGDGNTAARVRELEEERDELLRRYTHQHPQVIALDFAIRELRAGPGGQIDDCCRLVLVAYAWPGVASDRQR
jgi:hypothetical protein